MGSTPLHPAIVHLPLGLAFVMPLVMVALGLALWRGWLPGRRARVARARAILGTAEAERRRKADEIRLEVIRARENFLSAREKAAVAEESVTTAGETLRIVRDRYETGLTTITEMLRAGTALVRARRSLLVARYDTYVGYARTHRVVGTLNDVAVFE